MKKCPRCKHANPTERITCIQCGTRLSDASPAVAQKALGPQPSPGNSQTTLRPGENIAGRYTVERMIGRGGMGCIYLVRDNVLKEHVALKTLLPQFARDRMIVERFYNEARIARHLSHPNIVRIHDIGMANQVLYISMEYLHGKSLRKALEELMPGDRLPVRTTLELMDSLCAALEYAHQFTVHRDIKPENIMLTDGGALKLMDFGISKLMAETKLTSVAMVMGTPHYMSPEQLKDSSNVDARADIYSLGVVLYEVLSGNLPTVVPKPASQIAREVPPALDPIVAKCLDPDPGNRFQSASELRAALRPILEVVQSGTQALDANTGHARAVLRRALSRRVLGGLLAATVALVAAASIWQLDSRRHEIKGRAISTSGPVASHAGNLDTEPDAVRYASYLRDQAAATAQSNPERQPLFDMGQSRLDEAAARAEHDPDESAAWALAAIRCFEYVQDWPGNMIFVPPGLPSYPGARRVDGFFIDSAPVTARQFIEFDQSQTWRSMSDAGFGDADLDSPITSVRLYDALAYAAWKRAMLPSKGQLALAWERDPASEAEIAEWTRTCQADQTGREVDCGSDPSAYVFGAPFIVVTPSTDAAGAAVTAFVSRPFDVDGCDPALGFRCVIDFGVAQ